MMKFTVTINSEGIRLLKEINNKLQANTLNDKCTLQYGDKVLLTPMHVERLLNKLCPHNSKLTTLIFSLMKTADNGERIEIDVNRNTYDIGIMGRLNSHIINVHTFVMKKTFCRNKT